MWCCIVVSGLINNSAACLCVMFYLYMIQNDFFSYFYIQYFGTVLYIFLSFNCYFWLELLPDSLHNIFGNSWLVWCQIDMLVWEISSDYEYEYLCIICWYTVMSMNYWIQQHEKIISLPLLCACVPSILKTFLVGQYPLNSFNWPRWKFNWTVKGCISMFLYHNCGLQLSINLLHYIFLSRLLTSIKIISIFYWHLVDQIKIMQE